MSNKTIQPGTRIALPTAPGHAKKTSVSTCQHQCPDFVDILYVPSHPVTGKKMWYAITQEAKSKIDEEKANMDKMAKAIMSGDKASMLQTLNDLGILSKFVPKVFEQFLSSEDRDRFQTLYRHWDTIKTGEFIKHPIDPDHPYQYIADTIKQFDSGKTLKDYIGDLWIPFKTDAEAVDCLDKPQGFVGVDRVKHQIIKRLLDCLQRQIKELEERAKQNATHKHAKDGTKFIYDESDHYFTSQKQKAISDTLAQLHDRLGTMTDKKIASGSYHLAESCYRTWKDLDSIHKQAAKDPYKSLPTGNLSLIQSLLGEINERGFAIKEQCLSEAQLVGTQDAHRGPKTFREHYTGDSSNWNASLFFVSGTIFTDKDKPKAVIQHAGAIYDETFRPNAKDYTHVTPKALVGEAGLVEWALYPSLALIKTIDNTVTELRKGLVSALGKTSTPPDTLFSQLIKLKQVALARVELLKKMASKNASENPHLLHKYCKATYSSYTLIWDRDDYKPVRQDNGTFKNKAGFNDLQAVECCYMSDGKVFYLRGPWWYMPKSPEDNSLCRNFLAIIDVAMPDPQALNTTKDVVPPEAILLKLPLQVSWELHLGR